MRKYLRAFFILFAMASIVNVVKGQRLTRADFNVGVLKLRCPIDSVLTHLRKPDRTEADDVYEDYIGVYYFNSGGDSEVARIDRIRRIPGLGLHNYSDYIVGKYRKLVIWYNKFDSLVKGFDIQDSSFSTVRGLKVGDPASKLQSLYGNGILVKDPLTDGPYDLSFHDYSHIRLYSFGDYHLAFFTKDRKVTKIISFFRLSMYGDEWNVAFMKLNKPIEPALAHLGKPDRVTEEDNQWTGYYFPKLVLWKDNQTGTLCAMDIYDPAYATYRGLRIGSPASEVIKLYGDRYERMSEFERVGPYDYKFKNYTEAMVFGYSRYFVVFIKNQKVVKMLFYEGIEE